MVGNALEPAAAAGPVRRPEHDPLGRAQGHAGPQAQRHRAGGRPGARLRAGRRPRRRQHPRPAGARRRQRRDQCTGRARPARRAGVPVDDPHPPPGPADGRRPGRRTTTCGPTSCPTSNAASSRTPSASSRPCRTCWRSVTRPGASKRQGRARTQTISHWRPDMARFLLAWELGGGMGHVVPLAQVAEPLVQRGHEVHFVLRDLSAARAGLGALASAPRVRLWQAPVWQMPYQAPAAVGLVCRTAVPRRLPGRRAAAGPGAGLAEPARRRSSPICCSPTTHPRRCWRRAGAGCAAR